MAALKESLLRYSVSPERYVERDNSNFDILCTVRSGEGTRVETMERELGDECRLLGL